RLLEAVCVEDVEMPIGEERHPEAAAGRVVAPVDRPENACVTGESVDAPEVPALDHVAIAVLWEELARDRGPVTVEELIAALWGQRTEAFFVRAEGSVRIHQVRVVVQPRGDVH